MLLDETLSQHKIAQTCMIHQFLLSVASANVLMIVFLCKYFQCGFMTGVVRLKNIPFLKMTQLHLIQFLSIVKTLSPYP